ncbi:hypothetical protein LguiA_000516 [Lonicera macranthoides]
MKCFRTRVCVNLLLLVLCLGSWCNGDDETMAAPMEKTEQESLYSAIQGFVGKDWNGSDLYPDPCGWTPIQGVSCDLFNGLWYVTALTIGPINDNSLACASNVEFTSHLFALKHLKSLSFFNCMVSPSRRPITIPPNSWEVFADNLESLEFRSNPGLIGQIPPTFGVLTKLQSLVLLENGLSGQLPPNLGSLINLRRLVLAGNWLTGRIPDSYGGFSKLLILDLSRNSLFGTLPLTFGGLTSLLKLDLSKNYLEGEISLGNLKNLTLLDLSNNTFSGGLAKSIEEISSLEELVLSNNPIGGDLTSFEWHKLQGLTVLDLSNSGLTGEVPESIAELKRVRFLGLNENNLTGEIPPKLATLPCVSAMYLNGNNFNGKLNFSGSFYWKMGRRFGAWNNQNLCYPVGIVSTSRVPFGVKPCEDEGKPFGADVDEKAKLVNGNLNQNSNFIVSLGLSGFGADGIWCVFLVQLLMIVVVFNFSM